MLSILANIVWVHFDQLTELVQQTADSVVEWHIQNFTQHTYGHVSNANKRPSFHWRTRTTRCITANGKNFRQSRDHNHARVICHPVVRIDIAYLCTKFDDFSRSNDMTKAQKKLKGHISTNFSGKGGSHINDCWRQETRVPELSRGVVCVILRLAVLHNTGVWQRDRQTYTHTHATTATTRAQLTPRG